MGAGKLIEGVWDCKTCGTVRILGRYRECPHCGKVRDADTKFYMSDKKMYVPEEKAKEISREPDWVCRFCDCLNPATTDVCKSCGANRTGENLDYFENRKEKDKQEEQTKKPKMTFETDSSIELEYPSDDKLNFEPVIPVVTKVNDDDESSSTFSSDEINSAPTRFEKAKKFIGNTAESAVEFISDSLPAIGIIALIVLIIGSIVWLVVPRTRTVTVNHTYWEQTIEVERYQTVDESGWSLPSNARLHKSQSEIYTYKKVLDHYENKTRQVAKQRLDHYDTKVVGHRDLGNGYFEEITEQVPVYETYYETEHYQEPVYRSEPVYKTKYYYEVDKWLHDRNLTSSGIDSTPYLPDTSMLKSDERTATQRASYTFSGTDDKGDTKTYEASYSDWSDLKAGDTITIKVSIFGNVKSIEYHD